MMRTRHLLVIGLAGLALTACGEQQTERQEAETTPPPATVAAPAAQVEDPMADNPKADAETKSSIDWDAARRDFAARADDIPEEARVASAQSNGEPTAVPILLPSGNVSIESAGNVRLRPLSDGYFAAYPGAKYDIIVNGTNQTAGAPGEARTERADVMRYTATAAGAQVALSKYGADYLVEFECHNLDSETGTCITEEEALAICRELIVAGTR